MNILKCLMDNQDFDFATISPKGQRNTPCFEQNDFSNFSFDSLKIDDSAKPPKKSAVPNKKKGAKTESASINERKRSESVPIIQPVVPRIRPPEPPTPPPGWSGKTTSQRLQELNEDSSIVPDLGNVHIWDTIKPTSRKFNAFNYSKVNTRGDSVDFESAPIPMIAETSEVPIFKERRGTLPNLLFRRFSKISKSDETEEEQTELKLEFGLAENIRRLHREAQQGWIESQFSLAYCYDMGEGGVDSDTDKAIYWYREAAKGGHVTAMNNLGVLLTTGHRKRIPPNPVDAMVWYKRAADKGHPNAEFHMGMAAWTGYGMEKRDIDKALYWYKRAAKQGHMNAQANVGAIYFGKQNLEANYKKALKWSKRAAEQGSAIAHHNLAVIYAFGYGVPKDSTKVDYHLCNAMEGAHKNQIPSELSRETMANGTALMIV